MNNSPLLSVIIPVYNVEQYLSKCVDSILSQTFTDFELILVNDGSTDNSSKICDEYAKKDKRIRVFHRKNCGVSVSRNFGLDQALGDYVNFMDADDEIYPGTLEDNMKILLKNRNIDILQFPYYRVEKGNKIIKYAETTQIIYTDHKAIFKNLVYEGPITWASWGKIYKKDIYKRIFFPENMKIYEDLFALINIIENTHCLYISTLGGYLYYYREGSACNTGSKRLKSIDSCRISMLKYQKALVYNVGITKFWKEAVKESINFWAYYGSNDEIKNFLKMLYANKVNRIKTNSNDNKIVRIANILSPMIAARIQWIVVRILRLNKNNKPN